MAGTRAALLAVVLTTVAAGCSAGADTEGRGSSAARRAPASGPSKSSPAAPAGTVADGPSTSGARPSAAAIPPLSARARAAGLRDIRAIVPDAVVDLRYATSNNFTGVRLYPADARCLVHRSMAAGLRTAAAKLRRAGFVLVFWDCYRPRAVQVRMFEIFPDPAWVARPGPYATSHEAGRSVDVTLAQAATGGGCRSGKRVQRHCLLGMGTGFDDFTPRAHAYAGDGVSPAAEANRARLRRAMAAGGITVYSGEWWHFDGRGSAVPRPDLRAPLH